MPKTADDYEVDVGVIEEAIASNSDPVKPEKKERARYWREPPELALRDGRKKVIDSPADLWEKAQEYFNWIEHNPIRIATAKGEYTKPRAMSIQGLCRFIGIAGERWSRLSHRADNAGFDEVKSAILDVIYTQKIEYGMAGVFHPVIVVRDLGLRDQTTVTAPDGPVVVTKEASINDMIEAAVAVLSEQMPAGKTKH